MRLDLPDGVTKMDRRELKACACCGQGVMHDGDIHFYELRVNQCIVDLDSVRQQHGLEMMMGGAAPLAAVFAPSTNVAHRLPQTRLVICQPCALSSQQSALGFMSMGDEE